ncbi:MAG TPA: glycogen-binding domain-containing protein [Gemmatimonadaceae bacterium]|nr:glycogen-binding domain-containing protein [Gemmatimonadaceae bacterium]
MPFTALLLIARGAHAQQLESSLDLAALAVRYADTLSTSAATLTPHVAADWNTSSADVSATFSQFAAGGWSGQGWLSASTVTPTIRNFYGELTGSAGGSSHNDGNRTGEIVANGRVHFPRASGEMFFGAGVGRTWDGFLGRSLLLGEAGLAFGSEVRNALLTISPAKVTNSATYADAQGALSWKTGRTEIDALVGFRLGDQPGVLGSKTRSWASLSALRSFRDRFAFVASGGSYPIDPTQGFPGGKFVSLGVRLSRAHKPVAAPAAVEARGSAGETSQPMEPAVVLAGFDAIRLGVDSVTVRVNASGAKLVEINGDFTGWSPVKLSASTEAGWWAATLPLAAGKYQMNVRINGGEWTVPPGMLSMSDEFGGTVGLLVIQ